MRRGSKTRAIQRWSVNEVKSHLGWRLTLKTLAKFPAQFPQNEVLILGLRGFIHRVISPGHFCLVALTVNAVLFALLNATARWS